MRFAWTALLAAGCCVSTAAAPDAPATPTRAHAGSRWMASESGGSWVYCDVQPVDRAVNALRCQLVDAAGRCEAWSTYVHPDGEPIDAVPALDRVCLTRARAGDVEWVEHGRIELQCDGEPLRMWFCQFGRCLGPVWEGGPTPEAAFADVPCDVGAVR